MKVSIIIPVLNQLEFTKKCIQSIKESNNSVDYEIIVINNASKDGTEEYLKSIDIVLINNETNLGVAKSWNQGIKLSKGDFVFIINNDIIMCRDCIKNLVDFYDMKNIGILSPATREGDLNYNFLEYSEKFIKKMRKIKQEGFYGWAMLIKKDRFDKVGFFSEDFEIGIGEDTDFYLKLKKAGYKSYITGCALIHHFGSKTLKEVKKINGNDFEKRNICKLKDKWKIKEDNYFKRKVKSLLKNLKKMYFKIFYGYNLFEKV